ncbi:restriction endonuclease [Burkholderia gladioli]|uniref:nSTAND3 domain-containing NTPase n=1 Tax=Burkholderia gladioli TaxID=28095 RepID=UPI00163E9988|nr:restriction endonuclease [Burkholderia gladioli]
MYDFRTLSPIDFELLVRDLLQAEFGITMESFGPGKDGGIDFRFSMADQDVVVQAKHHVEGGARSLLRAAIRENCKVLKLAPSRYILVTSLSLTPALKSKIIQAMPSTPVSAGDVLGREDLNNLLGLHPHVLRQHFKLWLTSTEVLERILHSAVYNRTDAELTRIRQLVPKFVHNASLAEAEKILDDRGALIIAGEPGVGKTTLGRMLLWLHMEQNWKVFVVDDLQEAMAVSTAGEKRLIFLDDFLGQISLTNELLGTVDQRLPVFLDRLRNNKDLRFILTTRLYLLNQAQIQSDKLSSPRVAASEMTLNVGVYTRTIKAKVVFNHIYFSDLVDEEKTKLLDDDFFLKMIDHRNFSPRLIELLTSADYYSVGDESIQATVLRVLNNPAELWERPYRAHLSADARCLMWAIFFAGLYVGMDRCLQLFKRITANAGHQIASSEAVSRFRTGLKELSGSFVTVGDQEISFANPGIRDFLSKVFIDDHLLPIVVRSVSTIYELRSAWNFFRTNITMCCDQFGDHDLWLAAIDRIQGDKSTTAIASLRLILEMCEHLPGLHIKAVLDRAVDDLMSQGIEARDHYECLFSLRQLKRLQDRTDDLLDPACKTLTNAAANMLANAGDDLTIDEITNIAGALGPLTDQRVVRTAASEALQGFIFGIEHKLSDISSSQELDTFRDDLVHAAQKYGVRIDAALTQDIQNRRETLERWEDEEDADPYQQASPQDAVGEISDAEIKSMFSLMATGPASG